MARKWKWEWKYSQVYHISIGRIKGDDQDVCPVIVRRLRKAIRRGEKINPIDLTKGNPHHEIGDGYHRYTAHLLEGKKTIPARFYTVDKKWA